MRVIGAGVEERGRSAGGGERAASVGGDGYVVTADGDNAGEVLDEFELIRAEIGIRPREGEGGEDAGVGGSGIEIDGQSSGRERDGVFQVEVHLDALLTAGRGIERER